MRAFIFVNTQVRWLKNSLREIRNNQRNMSFGGDHRICPVGIALPCRARMNVNIGNDRQTGFAAELPERSVSATVENNYARIKRMRIEVIIISELRDSTP